MGKNVEFSGFHFLQSNCFLYAWRDILLAMTAAYNRWKNSQILFDIVLVWCYYSWANQTRLFNDDSVCMNVMNPRAVALRHYCSAVGIVLLLCSEWHKISRRPGMCVCARHTDTDTKTRYANCLKWHVITKIHCRQSSPEIIIIISSRKLMSMVPFSTAIEMFVYFL